MTAEIRDITVCCALPDGLTEEQAQRLRLELGLLPMALEEYVDDWLRRRDHPATVKVIGEAMTTDSVPTHVDGVEVIAPRDGESVLIMCAPHDKRRYVCPIDLGICLHNYYGWSYA